MNRNKFCCISELKQWLVDIWQSAVDYWRDHQWVKKATESVPGYRRTTFWTLIVSLSWDWKSHGQIKLLTLFIPKKVFLYHWVYDFHGLRVSQGKVRTRKKWGGKLNHLLMAYSLSNICTKNYWNWTVTVKIIVGRWGVYFFETQCRDDIMKTLLLWRGVVYIRVCVMVCLCVVDCSGRGSQSSEWPRRRRRHDSWH